MGCESDRKRLPSAGPQQQGPCATQGHHVHGKNTSDVRLTVISNALCPFEPEVQKRQKRENRKAGDRPRGHTTCADQQLRMPCEQQEWTNACGEDEFNDPPRRCRLAGADEDSQSRPRWSMPEA